MRECYAPLARIPVGPDPAHATDTVNAYAWMSFDVGPTLVEWLETEAPAVLAAMVAGDRESRARLGTGNAMAMPYHHVILPLCTLGDRRFSPRLRPRARGAVAPGGGGGR